MVILKLPFFLNNVDFDFVFENVQGICNNLFSDVKYGLFYITIQIVLLTVNEGNSTEKKC